MMQGAQCMRPDLQLLVARYELGGLAGEERVMFEKHALECDACFAELERGAQVAALLSEQRARFLAMLGESPRVARSQPARSEPSPTPPPSYARKRMRLVPDLLHRLLRPRVLVPACASMLVGLGLWQEARRNDIRRWASFPHEIAPAGRSLRDAEIRDAVTELLDAGAACFDLGQHAEAEQYYRSALERDGESAQAAYGLGLVLAVRGDPRGAIPFLERATASAGAEHRDLALWVLANAHLAASDRDGALSVLARLGSTAGPYASAAQDLERRLRQ